MNTFFVSDMDGTFLRDDKTYDDHLFKFIYQKMQTNKDHFIVASGNNFTRIKDIFPNQTISAISDNGAAIYKNDQLVDCYPMSQSKALDFVSSVEHLELPIHSIILSDVYHSYTLKKYKEHMTEQTRFFYKKLSVLDTWSTINEPILKISIKTDPIFLEEVSKKLQNRFSHLFTILPSGYRAIDVIKKGCNKGTALTKLLSHFKMYSTKEYPLKVWAFGNEQNDIPLFQVADYRIAVANSSSSLIKKSNRIIGTNQEQSVLHEISTFYYQS